MENIISVAKYICLEYNRISGHAIDEMKLHKLLYLAQRETLAITNEPLFEEVFEGWKYGPVNREVRKKFKEGIITVGNTCLKPESVYIVNNVILQYGEYEPWKLSDLSHSEISWQNARKGIPLEVNGSNLMKLEDIREDAKKIRPYDSVFDMYYDEFEDCEL